ncbi:class I SAM-dependent methyltransferase [Virgibacillus sp. DJP39]|uniref:class I SAM-dependent methyltransferase n=1 Tax=Virgibacillus sp. DJP39 TaxID=3409790 RepID=UPI003BB69D9A
MGKWFPNIYDVAMKPLEKNRFKKIRKKLIDNASGRVLEIGSGSGINFSYYKNVDQVDAIEPNPEMSKLAQKRIHAADIPIQTHAVGAEGLPFNDDTFDCVVATLVFCTIPNPIKAINEIQRVSKPGAKLLFFEHVRMNQKVLAKLQDGLTPVWKKLCDGCHLNRDTLGLLSKTGIVIEQVDYYYKGLFLTTKAKNNKEPIRLSNLKQDK